MVQLFVLRLRTDELALNKPRKESGFAVER